LSNGITHTQYGEIKVTGTTIGVTCFGDQNGIVEMIPSEGAGSPFSITWTNYNNATQNRLTGLATGSYQFSITDRIGCQLQGSIDVASPSQPSGTATSTDIVCFGQKNGKINLSGTSDYGGFQYILNQETPVSFDSGNAKTIENLDKGTYTVRVIDAKGCTVLANTTLQIQEPTELKVTLQKLFDQNHLVQMTVQSLSKFLVELSLMALNGHFCQVLF
jgi:hypothetical protein